MLELSKCGIHSSGGNATNGYWTKYDNGDFIFRGSIHHTDMTSSYGFVQFPFSLPHAVYSVLFTNNIVSTSYYGVGTQWNTNSKETYAFSYWIAGVPESATFVQADFVLLGKWK